MSKVFYRKQFSDYLGENRSILDVVIGFVPDGTQPTPTSTNTPTPTRTPQPTPVTGLTSQVEVLTNDGNITITGVTWEVEFDGLPYSGSTGDTRNQVKICVEFQSFPQKGASYLYQINYPAGFTYDSSLPFNEFILDVGDFQGLILGTYRWDGTITRYLNSVQYGSPISSTIIYDPTPTTDGGCLLDIILVNDLFFVEPIPTLTPTPTPTPSITPTNTTTPTPTPTPSGAAFDPDAEVYLEQVLFAGGSLDSTISGATNTLFTSLKSAGIYSKIEVMYPFLGGVANSTAINAIDPNTYFIQWNGGVTHNVSGVTGNGTNGYGNSQYSNQNFSGDSLHVVCAQNLASTTGGDYNYGTTGVDPRLQFAPDNVGNLINWRGGPNILNTPSNSGITTAISIMTRDATTTTDLYLDGTLIDSITGSYSSGVDRNMYVLALNVSNAPLGGSYSDGRLCFLSFGKGLSSSEVTDFNNIVDTFNTTLNRNP